MGGKVADSATFGEPACGPARPTSVDGLFGVSLDTPGWATAGPGCDEAMAAKAVRVGPNEVGLLVTQRDGGEHVGHQHWFFVNRGGKLFAAWSPASDNRSGFDARVVSAPGGAYEDLALIDVVGVDGDADQAIERVVVRRLHWDAQSGGMVVSAMPDPGIRSARFPSVRCPRPCFPDWGCAECCAARSSPAARRPRSPRARPGRARPH